MSIQFCSFCFFFLSFYFFLFFVLFAYTFEAQLVVFVSHFDLTAATADRYHPGQRGKGAYLSGGVGLDPAVH